MVADAIQSSGYFTSLDSGLAGHWLKVQDGRLENRVALDSKAPFRRFGVESLRIFWVQNSGKRCFERSKSFWKLLRVGGRSGAGGLELSG